MNDPRRLFRYVLAFAGGLTVLYAVTGLVGLTLSTAFLRDDVLAGTEDARIRASLYLAELIIGLPVWLTLWTVSQRRAATREEQESPERRLYLAAVFATTSIVALFALRSVLHYIFTLPGTSTVGQTSQDALFSVARLLIFGAAWLYHARISWRERDPREEDAAHDLAVYLLAGFSLAFLAGGVLQALGQILEALLGLPQPTLVAGTPRSAWDRWGGIASWLLSGALVWGLTWQYDLSRRGVRPVREIYLYLVLLVAVPSAVGSATAGLYELLRRALGYSPESARAWEFLTDILPVLIVAGIVWAHHWAVVRRQPAPSSSAQRHVPGSIAWPRRPGVVLLNVLGLAMAASALISLVWLALDSVLNTGASLSGGAWWRDRLSLSVAVMLVGFPVWLGSWRLLQRAATTAPETERTSLERRQLLGFVVLVSSLLAIGFGVALLWLVLQALLGAGLDSNDISTMLKQLSATGVALALLAYYGQTLRRDLAFGPARIGKLRVIAFVAPGAEDVLERLREETGTRIDVIGRLSETSAGEWADLPALERQLAELHSQRNGESDRALLLLTPQGGSLHPYSPQRG